MSGLTYRSWVISYDPPPIPVRSCDWQFWHEDYDGPEDGRSGHAGSLAEAKAEIDLLEDDAQAEAEEAADRARMVNVGGHRNGGSAS